MKLKLGFICLLVLAASLIASTALAAPTAIVNFNINERGAVQVTDRWAEIEAGADNLFQYFSGTLENGTIPVRVKDGKFTIVYYSKSLLSEKDDKIFFRSTDYYYEKGEMDIKATLDYPANLEFVKARPEPTSVGGGKIVWDLTKQQHTMLIAEFKRIKPWLRQGEAPETFLFDPRALPALEGYEIPINFDQVMEELDVVVRMGILNQKTDPDYSKALRKIQRKLYYLMLVNGLVSQYKDDEGNLDNKSNVTQNDNKPTKPKGNFDF